MIILDTDILSLLDAEIGETYENLLTHLTLPGNNEVATTYWEQWTCASLRSR